MRNSARIRRVYKAMALLLSSTMAVLLVAVYAKEIDIFRSTWESAAGRLQGVLQSDFVVYNKKTFPNETHSGQAFTGVQREYLLEEQTVLPVIDSAELTIASPSNVILTSHVASEHLVITKRILELMNDQRDVLERQIDKQAERTADSFLDKFDDVVKVEEATAGDILYVNSSGDVETLPAGSNGQVLTARTTVLGQGQGAPTVVLPTWESPSQQGLLTTAQDIVLDVRNGIFFDSGSNLVALSAGTVGQVLAVAATPAGDLIPTWQDAATGGSSLITAAGNGAIIAGDQTGNSRGATALDVQSVRSVVTQVASGGNSVAVGRRNTASGPGAIAVGSDNTSSSYNAVALGYLNNASGGYAASAVGAYNTASGYYSTAIGHSNTASSDYSAAFGYDNQATGEQAIVFGRGSTVSADYASAFGFNISNGIANSAMFGPNNSAKLTILNTGEVQGNFFTGTVVATSTFAGPISIASGQEYRVDGVGILTRQGNGTLIGGDVTGDQRGPNSLDFQANRTLLTQVASGSNSITVGLQNTASDNFSTALGRSNTASGRYSSAFGNSNTASVYESSAFGRDNVVTGDYSVAFGAGNNTSGNYSSSFGQGNTASGLYATAAGYGSDVSGDYTTALGFNTTASADYASVFGTNITNNVIGSTMIGPSNTAKLTILSSGNMGIGTTTPTAQLHTTGSVRFSAFGSGSLNSDANGNITVSSDERLKQIASLYTATSSIQNIMGIDPIQYRWASSTGFDADTLYTGFSAQNVAEFIPEAVGEDNRGFLTLSDRPILATVINALKEMWGKITTNEDDIAELQRENEQLKRELEVIKDELDLEIEVESNEEESEESEEEPEVEGGVESDAPADTATSTSATVDGEEENSDDESQDEGGPAATEGEVGFEPIDEVEQEEEEESQELQTEEEPLESVEDAKEEIADPES